MARRRLSPEERELWRRVAQTAVPLRTSPPEASEPDPPPPELVPVSPKTRRRAGSEEVSSRPWTAAPRRVTLDLAPDPHAVLDRSHVVMDRRRFEKLRRGRLEPEARLDLHGMTSERAHGELIGFMLAAHAAGLRLVLVITGKGRPGEPETHAPHRHGILRHSLPHWLSAPPLAGKVMQVVPAHQRHGGGGAFYVYLRRRA